MVVHSRICHISGVLAPHYLRGAAHRPVSWWEKVLGPIRGLIHVAYTNVLVVWTLSYTGLTLLGLREITLLYWSIDRSEMCFRATLAGSNQTVSFTRSVFLPREVYNLMGLWDLRGS